MKHMTSYVFNKDIKTIDDAVNAVNPAMAIGAMGLTVQIARNGTSTMFIQVHNPDINMNKLIMYEVAKLDDVLKIICDDLGLLKACVNRGVVVPK